MIVIHLLYYQVTKQKSIVLVVVRCGRKLLVLPNYQTSNLQIMQAIQFEKINTQKTKQL